MNDMINNELIVERNPRSSVAEALRIIRTNLQFSSADKKVQIILVTSSVPGEGKSFTSANLATAFAQNGSKVLLIDCDLRKGRLHRLFNITNDKGLSNLLLGDVEKEYKDYIKKTFIHNLHLLTSGVVPPNPSELLDSNKNKNLLEILRSDYDYSMCDGTPVGGLTDSVVMAKNVDKTVVVCAVNYTKIDQLENTKKTLQNVEADVAGVIVNKVPEVHSSYYGNYYIED